MKNFILLFFCLPCIFSCSSTKTNNSSNPQNDTRFYHQLEKTKRNATAGNLEKLSKEYELAKLQHLNNIDKGSSNATEQGRFNVIEDYQALQDMFDSAQSTTCCNKLPGLINYREKLDGLKLSAADYFYDKGNNLLGDTTAEGIRQTYNYFEKAAIYVPGYKDAAEKKDELYRSNVFIVAFSPVEDTLYFTEKNLSAGFYAACNAYFVDTLISHLYRQRSPVPFLKLMKMDECISQHVNPDWFINISLPEMNSSVQTETKTRSTTEQVAIGTDTAGRTIYRNEVVYKDYIYDVVSSADVDLQVDVTDLQKHETIFTKHFTATYSPNNRVNGTSGRIPFFGLSTSNNLSLREAAIGSLFMSIFGDYINSIAHMLGN